MSFKIGKIIKILSIVLLVLEIAIAVCIGIFLFSVPAAINEMLPKIEFPDMYGYTMTVNDLEWYSEYNIAGIISTVFTAAGSAVIAVCSVKALISFFRNFGYGELIDKTADNAAYTKQILAIYQQSGVPAVNVAAPAQQQQPMMYPSGYDYQQMPGYGAPVQNFEQPGQAYAPRSAPLYDQSAPISAPEAQPMQPVQPTEAPASQQDGGNVCPACGTPNENGFAFCIKCGAKIK